MEKDKSTRKSRGRPVLSKNTNDGFVAVDWFEAHKEAKLKLPKRPTEAKFNFSKEFWPVGGDYYSPLNPIFVAERFHPSKMNERAVWLARDGLVPLLWFFKLNPEPGVFRSRILIHEDFSPFVPEAWRPRMGTYRLSMDAETARSIPRTLLVTGLISDSYCSLSGLQDILDRLEERISSEQLAKLNKVCFLPVQLHLSANRQSFQAAYFVELFKRCGTSFQSVEWGWIEGQPVFTDTIIVDMNEMLLCADNFIIHMALQKGAEYLPLTGQGNTVGGNFVRLSPYHGVVIKDSLTGRFALEGDAPAEIYFSQFERAMRSHANRNFPWPSWISEWGQAISRRAREAQDRDHA